MNNIMIVISVISIVAILMYIPLKGSGFLPIRNMYRPPIPKKEPVCETMEEVYKRLKSPCDIDRVFLRSGKKSLIIVIKG